MADRPTATDLMVWGLVAHLIADWPLQNDWMAQKKSSLRHPAGYVHAGVHGAALAPVFGIGAVPLAVTHLLIDTRKPVAWFSRLMRQTQPDPSNLPLMDVGTTVRFWTDQVWHIACLALAAQIVSRRD